MKTSTRFRGCILRASPAIWALVIGGLIGDQVAYTAATTSAARAAEPAETGVAQAERPDADMRAFVKEEFHTSLLSELANGRNAN